MKTDLEIQQDVMEELKWEPFISSTEIGVVVKHGIVSLTGTVDSYAKKISAEKAVQRVAGVKAVAQEIEVKLSNSGWRDDAEIAEAIVHTLKWQTSVDENRIKIKVENGWVTLEGDVDWVFEKNQVTDAIENLMGVRGITCLIKVLPLIPPKEIERKIKAAFHRSASIDAATININTIGNKVILTGSVKSFGEKKDAENAAWAAPGVNEVENKLTVEQVFSVSE
jgi:osmotically-inducible protein OsmY